MTARQEWNEPSTHRCRKIGESRNSLFRAWLHRVDMRGRFMTMVAVVVLLSGCTTKKASERKQRSAYAAGRQHAMLAQAEKRESADSEEPTVTFSGDVDNRSIPWREGLSLANAIVEAGHNSRRNPRKILIHRRELVFEVPAWRLLQGDDFLIEAGDHIELRR